MMIAAAHGDDNRIGPPHALSVKPVRLDPVPAAEQDVERDVAQLVDVDYVMAGPTPPNQRKAHSIHLRVLLARSTIAARRDRLLQGRHRTVPPRRTGCTIGDRDAHVPCRMDEATGGIRPRPAPRTLRPGLQPLPDGRGDGGIDLPKEVS